MPVWKRATAREWEPTRFQRTFMERNQHLNSVLYAMCEESPSHRDRGAIRAKVVIIGRTYASGLERHCKGGLGPVVDVLHSERSWLDKEITALRRFSDHQPTTARISKIAVFHAQLQSVLQSVIRNGNSVRSFVSKYLHFHAPVVPIFDQYASAALADWYRWPPRPLFIDPPSHIDIPYWRHCVRTAFVVNEWRALNVRDPTARAIDDYAIAWWENSP